ncbi:MAG: hypothetical protein RL020_1211, partial [Pseudomonadota bacterium]
DFFAQFGEIGGQNTGGNAMSGHGEHFIVE